MLDFGGTAYWNFDTQSFDPNGTLLGLPTNGNVQVLYYRTDLYEKAGLKVPETWDELLANGKALNNPPDVYGFVPRAEKGSILYNWTPYLFSYGGSFFADPAKGDYSVTLASPEALKALEMYITLGKEAGPENFGAIAQAELAQLLATGKAAQAIAVVAIYSNLAGPQQSVVAGKIGTALLPAGPGGKHSSAAGHWMAGIAGNVPEANQKAALDFMKWFLERDQPDRLRQGRRRAGAQRPHRQRAREPTPPLPSCRPSRPTPRSAQMNMPLIPGVQIRDAISLWLNRAVIGEVTPTEALNGAAADANKILVDGGLQGEPALEALITPASRDPVPGRPSTENRHVPTIEPSLRLGPRPRGSTAPGWCGSLAPGRRASSSCCRSGRFSTCSASASPRSLTGAARRSLHFVGLQKLRRPLHRTSRSIGPAFGNTLVFAACAVTRQMVLGFAMALAVRRASKVGRGVLTAIFLLPIVIPPIVIGAMWRLMLGRDFGIMQLHARLVRRGSGRLAGRRPLRPRLRDRGRHLALDAFRVPADARRARKPGRGGASRPPASTS